nr:MAG TPA: ssDNA binding protein [Caudoviricetes sp.]
MTGYSVKIQYCSKELTARDRVAIKDTTNAISLDEATQASKVIIDIDYYAKLAVHNEHSEDKDYDKYIIVAKDGTKYVTGSTSFLTAMEGIVDEMVDSGEDFQIVVYRMPSKNYKGKEFLTCSIV